MIPEIPFSPPETLHKSSGRDLRKALFSLKRIFKVCDSAEYTDAYDHHEEWCIITISHSQLAFVLLPAAGMMMRECRGINYKIVLAVAALCK